MEEYIIAIDLGGTTSKMAIITPEGDILEKWSIPTDISNQGSQIVANIIGSIDRKIVEKGINTDQLLGIGMGTPGSVNHIEGTVIGAYNLNWSTLQDIKGQFNDAFSVPFYLENDANIAALGEQWQGAGNNEDHVVMVTLGTGVGGGVVIDGHLLHGAMGSAGEIGHITIDPDSIFDCTCGKKGCLEALASATGVVNLAIHYIATNQTPTSLSDILNQEKELTSKDIFDHAQAGDQVALEIVDQFSRYLGLACSHLANILNSSKIILGGGVSQAGEFLRQQVEDYTRQYAFPTIRDTTHVVLATLGNDAGILGGARLVLNGVQ